MRNFYCYTIIFLFFAGCKNNTLPRPVWINASDSIVYPNVKLEFKTNTAHWSATLLTFVQPIELATQYANGKLVVTSITFNGITESPGKICLQNGKELFFYNVYLQNKAFLTANYKDYRSPKTVNPDSSLRQQRIIYSIDSNRNIVPTPGHKNYFYEEEISLPPKTSTTRAIAEQPVTAFYVQPGSCTNIPVAFNYDTSSKSYMVTAGPLEDKYHNKVADGTLVNFIYSDTERTYSMEKSLLNRFAKISIPSPEKKRYNLIVKLNQTVSGNINLKVK